MSSPNITFQTIPDGIRKPGAYFEEITNQAIQGLTPVNDLVVILAQKTASGIVPEKTPTKIFDSGTAQLDFGAGSIAHLAAMAALEANPNVALTVVGIDDANGSAPAGGSIAINDTTAVSAGSINIWVGDQIATANFTAGATAASISASLMTSLTAVSNLLPVTDSSSGGVITFNAKNGGTLGNFIPLSAKVTQGLSAVVVTPMTNGSGDPDLGDYASVGTVLNSIVAGGYTIVANTNPSADALGKVKDLVEFVSGPMEQRPAIQVSAVTDLVDSYGNLEILAGITLNHGRTTIPYINYANDNLAKTECFKIAGAYASVLASQSDPAVPYDGLLLTPVAPPAVTDRWTRTQEEDLLKNGLTPLDVVPGDEVQIVRAISTYTTNSLSIPDPTLLDINTIRTLDYVRAQIRTRLGIRFVRAKLTKRIARQIRVQVIDVLGQLEQLEIVQNVSQWSNGIIVETDSVDPTRIDIKVPSNIVSGLHIIAGQIILVL